jgi:hypothetical protein
METVISDWFNLEDLRPANDSPGPTLPEPSEGRSAFHAYGQYFPRIDRLFQLPRKASRQGVISKCNYGARRDGVVAKTLILSLDQN